MIITILNIILYITLLYFSRRRGDETLW